jgi:hypothetical protein
LVALAALLLEELAERQHVALSPVLIVIGMLVAMFLIRFKAERRLFNVSLWPESTGSDGSLRMRFTLALGAIGGLFAFPLVTQIGGERPGPDRLDFAVAYAGIALLFIRSLSKQNLAITDDRKLLYVVVGATWLATLLAPAVSNCKSNCAGYALTFPELAFPGLVTLFAVYKVRAVVER